MRLALGHAHPSCQEALFRQAFQLGNHTAHSSPKVTLVSACPSSQLPSSQLAALLSSALLPGAACVQLKPMSHGSPVPAGRAAGRSLLAKPKWAPALLALSDRKQR